MAIGRNVRFGLSGRHEHSLLGVVVSLALLLPLQACATTYSAEPIEAWVVDSENSSPIEGVVVTANWELEEGTLGGNRPAGQIMVMETVTDNKGRFNFPAWGPKSTPLTFPQLLTSEPHLVTRDPHLLFFKSGYKWLGLENNFTGDYNKGSLRKSDYNGKTIKLERFTGDLKEYAKYLDFFDPRFIREDCNWKRVPEMVLAIDQQGRLFRRNGIGTPLLSINSLEGMSPKDRELCGSAREFFERGHK